MMIYLDDLLDCWIIFDLYGSARCLQQSSQMSKMSLKPLSQVHGSSKTDRELMHPDPGKKSDWALFNAVKHILAKPFKMHLINTIDSRKSSETPGWLKRLNNG